MNRKYGFVILNYMTPEETEGCIASIRQHIREEYEIIVVDNASPDGSGAELRSRYAGCEDVKVIINSTNVGFARGNNAGIRLAGEDGCDYVIELNSDTRIIQDNFCSIINEQYVAHGYAAIGPKIYKNGVESGGNPGRDKPMNNAKIRIFIAMNYVLLALSVLRLDKPLNELYIRYADSKRMRYGSISSNVEKVALHGCCIAFTPAFFSRFDGFDERTYMYMEEDVLYHHIVKAGLVSAYVPQLVIEHSEEAATKRLYAGVEKRRFKYRNYIRSSKVLLQLDKEKA